MRAPRVLVAYDGSEQAARALDAVARLDCPASTRIRTLAVQQTHLRGAAVPTIIAEEAVSM